MTTFTPSDCFIGSREFSIVCNGHCNKCRHLVAVPTVINSQTTTKFQSLFKRVDRHIVDQQANKKPQIFKPVERIHSYSPKGDKQQHHMNKQAIKKPHLSQIKLNYYDHYVTRPSRNITTSASLILISLLLILHPYFNQINSRQNVVDANLFNQPFNHISNETRRQQTSTANNHERSRSDVVLVKEYAGQAYSFAIDPSKPESNNHKYANQINIIKEGPTEASVEQTSDAPSKYKYNLQSVSPAQRLFNQNGQAPRTGRPRFKRSSSSIQVVPRPSQASCSDCLAIPLVAFVGRRQINGFVVRSAPNIQQRGAVPFRELGLQPHWRLSESGYPRAQPILPISQSHHSQRDHDLLSYKTSQLAVRNQTGDAGRQYRQTTSRGVEMAYDHYDHHSHQAYADYEQTSKTLQLPFEPKSDEKCPMVGHITVCNQIDSYPADVILKKLEGAKKVLGQSSFNLDSFFSDESEHSSEPFDMDSMKQNAMIKTKTMTSSGYSQYKNAYEFTETDQQTKQHKFNYESEDEPENEPGVGQSNPTVDGDPRYRETRLPNPDRAFSGHKKGSLISSSDVSISADSPERPINHTRVASLGLRGLSRATRGKNIAPVKDSKHFGASHEESSALTSRGKPTVGLTLGRKIGATLKENDMKTGSSDSQLPANDLWSTAKLPGRVDGHSLVPPVYDAIQEPQSQPLVSSEEFLYLVEKRGIRSSTSGTGRGASSSVDDSDVATNAFSGPPTIPGRNLLPPRIKRHHLNESVVNSDKNDGRSTKGVAADDINTETATVSDQSQSHYRRQTSTTMRSKSFGYFNEVETNSPPEPAEDFQPIARSIQETKTDGELISNTNGASVRHLKALVRRDEPEQVPGRAANQSVDDDDDRSVVGVTVTINHPRIAGAQIGSERNSKPVTTDKKSERSYEGGAHIAKLVSGDKLSTAGQDSNSLSPISTRVRLSSNISRDSHGHGDNRHLQFVDDSEKNQTVVGMNKREAKIYSSPSAVFSDENLILANEPTGRSRRQISSQDESSIIGGGDSISDPARAELIDPADRVQPICRARSIYISPRAALNDKKQWKYVVNAPERDPRVKQIVRVDICENPFEPCSEQVTIPFGFTSQCKQKYAKKKLLALDSRSGLLEVDTFFIPSCCVCQLILDTRSSNSMMTPINEAPATTNNNESDEGRDNVEPQPAPSGPQGSNMQMRDGLSNENPDMAVLNRPRQQ